MEHANPGFAALTAAALPDGDVDLEHVDFGDFAIPACPRCGGVVKPDVVFFGESVPRARVEQVRSRLQEAAAVLVVGSSLAVYSAYRFCLAATATGKPIAAVNLGRTRADDQLFLKITAPCSGILPTLARRLEQAAA